MSVARTVWRFYHFLLWKGEFYFDEVVKFEPKKITSSKFKMQCISYFLSVFLDSVLSCLQTKTHAVTSLERAHYIEWYKQKRLPNRWAPKQVPQQYFKHKICLSLSVFIQLDSLKIMNKQYPAVG